MARVLICLGALALTAAPALASMVTYQGVTAGAPTNVAGQTLPTFNLTGVKITDPTVTGISGISAGGDLSNLTLNVSFLSPIIGGATEEMAKHYDMANVTRVGDRAMLTLIPRADAPLDQAFTFSATGAVISVVAAPVAPLVTGGDPPSDGVSTPEPASALLLGLGAAGLMWRRRTRSGGSSAAE